MSTSRARSVGTRWGLTAAALVAASIAASASEAVVVGAMTPSIRPPNAPAIHGIHNGVDWYRHALTGVSAPYPPSLSFLDVQGEWYTPFTRPGMPGPYDIRHWHTHQ